MFTHYIITRFNLRNREWATSKNKQPVLTNEWLKNRFKLFENFCFSSVQHQTNQNFTWLVFFDTATPAEWREKIEGYKNAFPNFKALFIDGMEAFYPSIQNEISKASTSYIITTRIDNDDCISKHFVSEIQSRFHRQPYMAIDFIDGYTLQLHPEVKAGKRRQAYNPFISLIEKNEAPKTVWHKTHTAWKKEKHIMRVTDIRIWMSLIHAENQVNSFVGYGAVGLENLFQDFIIEKQLSEQLINKQKIISNFHPSGVINKLRSYWRTFYKDIKKNLGAYK